MAKKDKSKYKNAYYMPCDEHDTVDDEEGFKKVPKANYEKKKGSLGVPNAPVKGSDEFGDEVGE